VRPGLPLIEMCEGLEASVRALIEERGLDAGGWGVLVSGLGWAFVLGLWLWLRPCFFLFCPVLFCFVLVGLQVF
jgi:hypothetical protein